MKKPRLSGSLDYMSGTPGDSRRTSASGSLTLSGSLGSITPGMSYSKDTSRQQSPDGVVTDQFGNRIGVSINGELFLDESGTNKLRAGAFYDQTKGGYQATAGEELLGEDSYSGALEGYSLGADLGPLSFDVNKAGDDIFGRAVYRAGENTEFSVEDSNRGDPTFGFQFAKSFAEGGEVRSAPNRMTAYQNARAATPPQKGLTYSELLLDNIIGLDNDYLSAGEQLGQAFNADEIGFLKNAGISAYEGAKKVVADPIGAGEELLFGIYDSVENLATEDLDARLKRMYGIGYDQASEDQVTSARESVFGDALKASELIPGAYVAKRLVDTVDTELIDPMQRRQAGSFFNEVTNLEFDPKNAANSRFYYPSYQELAEGTRTQEPAFMDYATRATEAEKLLGEGVSPEVVMNTTGVMPVPLRTTTGFDAGFRLVMPTDDSGIAGLRTKSPYRISTREDIPLAEGTSGSFGPDYSTGARARDYVIALDPNLSPEEKASVYRHERTHGDLTEAEIGWNEAGMSQSRALMLQEEALNTLDDLIGRTTDVTEKADYTKLRDELKDLTSFELYSRNPGEMLARLSQGDPTMAKRLSALQVLNPYINPVSLPKRLKESLKTALMSETRPVVRNRMFSDPDNALLSGFDIYANVPMDMDKALINDPGFVLENPSLVAPSQAVDPNALPFARGGIVKGSYLDNDPYD